MRKWLKRLTLVLSAASLMFSTGCGHQKNADTSWVLPIYFQPESVSWLAERQAEWPSTLLGDLDKINKHNQKYEALHPHDQTATP